MARRPRPLLRCPALRRSRENEDRQNFRWARPSREQAHRPSCRASEKMTRNAKQIGRWLGMAAIQETGGYAAPQVPGAKIALRQPIGMNIMVNNQIRDIDSF